MEGRETELEFGNWSILIIFGYGNIEFHGRHVSRHLGICNHICVKRVHWCVLSLRIQWKHEVSILILATCFKGFIQYAGPSSSSNCHCGNTYGDYGLDHSGACTSTCSGNSEEICGAINFNNIYRIYSERRHFLLLWLLLYSTITLHHF